MASSRKILLDSDKMSQEEYDREDFSRMQNLVDDYYRVRTPGKVIIDYQERLKELVDEILRDPRNFSRTPDFLFENAPGRTRLESEAFWSDLFTRADPIDMRNKVERMMDKPESRVTPSEIKAFKLFAQVKKLPQIDGVDSIRPEIYFLVHDKVHRGHKAIKELDKERNAFGEFVPPEFERDYQRRLADIVIEAPQILKELPKDISENMTPPNFFYERMTERIDTLEQYRKDVMEKRASGEEVTQEDVFKYELLDPVEKYAQSVERHAEEMLSRLESQATNIPEAPAFSDDDLIGITEEDMMYFASDNEVSDADINSYYEAIASDEMVPPEMDNISYDNYDYDVEEDLYYTRVEEPDTLPSISDDANFASLEHESTVDLNEFDDNFDFDNYVFVPESYDIIEIDEYSADPGSDFIFGNNDELQALGDEWYELNNKNHLTKRDIDKMVELETEMGEMVADDQSLYISVPSEVSDVSKGNSAFFNAMIDMIDELDLDVEPIIESDLNQYKETNKRWEAYNHPREQRGKASKEESENTHDDKRKKHRSDIQER